MAKDNFKELVPGLKVEIRILQEANRERSGLGTAHTYITTVFDTSDDGTLILNMPFDEGRLVPLPTDVRYEFVFATTKGLLKAEGTITQRFKKDNFYLLKVDFSSDIEKFQRREYYRLNCLIPMMYITLDQEAGALTSVSDIHDLLQSDITRERIMGRGTIVDISGGGIRFTTSKDLGDVAYLMLQFSLNLDGKKEQIEIIGQVVSSHKVEESGTSTYRVKILFKDSKCQEKIIRFIFEEERRQRKREQG